jgi:hypothetical protein
MRDLAADGVRDLAAINLFDQWKKSLCFGNRADVEQLRLLGQGGVRTIFKLRNNVHSRLNVAR